MVSPGQGFGSREWWSVIDLDEAVDVLRHAADRGMVDAEPDITVRSPGCWVVCQLALEFVVAGRIRASPDWTLSDHLERLSHHRLSLRLDRGCRGGDQPSYRDLPADQQRVFRLLLLQPGGDITPAAAAALIGTDIDAAGRQLDQFASLLQRGARPVDVWSQDLLDWSLSGVA
jgi:hypothetical protein